MLRVSAVDVSCQPTRAVSCSGAQDNDAEMPHPVPRRQGALGCPLPGRLALGAVMRPAQTRPCTALVPLPLITSIAVTTARPALYKACGLWHRAIWTMDEATLASADMIATPEHLS